MTQKSIPDSQALKQAYAALRSGDKQGARHWAQISASLAPDIEDPWLILAAVGSRRASLAYLERALVINPDSPRALKGLEWARERQNQEITRPVRRQAVPVSTGADPATQPNPAIQKAQAAPIPAPVIPAARTKPGRRPHPSRDKRLWGLLLISPWLIGLLVFKLAPLFATLGISFTDFYLLEPGKLNFVGLKNYIDMFKDPYMYSAFLGTLKLALIVIPIQTAAAILLAALLSDEKLRMKDTLRVLFFLPSIIPATAAMFMFDGFVDPQTGWLSALFLNPLGLAKYINFGLDGPLALLPILTTLWSIGPGFMIIIGVMQGIPVDIFEAALVDGANRVRRFFSITLPLVTPAIFFTIILNLTAVFGGALLLERGSAVYSNRSSVDNYLYFMLFSSFRLGAASSLAWIFFIVLLVLVIVIFITSKRWVYFPDQDN